MDETGQRISLKGKLRTRAATIGSWLSLGSTLSAEIMATCGFEWLVVDMEHTGTSVADMMRQIQVVSLAGCVPLVRVGANDPLQIKRAFDCGAHGVIVPTVNTVEEARAAVASAYYPPKGTRGVGLFRAQNYGMEFDAYREWASSETVVIVQIEHHLGVRNLEAILAIEGVDGFMIGPYDLSGSIGKPGAFEDPDVKALFDRITQLIPKLGKPAGQHIVQPSEAKLEAALAADYRIIAYGIDQLFLGLSARAAANAGMTFKSRTR